MIYIVSEVDEREALEFVMKLEEEGNVSELQVTETTFFSSIMFLTKANQTRVKKVVDFWFLNVEYA